MEWIFETGPESYLQIKVFRRNGTGEAWKGGGLRGYSSAAGMQERNEKEDTHPKLALLRPHPN